MEMKCNLIIDSCCDLPADVVEHEGVYLLQFPYYDDEGQYLDDLYRSRSAHDFYESMRNGNQPHTAQLPIPSLRAAFEWAHDQGKPAVFLSFTSGLSGTFSTASLLLSQMQEEIPDLDVRLVDTKLASIAEALLVYEAINQCEKGLSADEMVAWAEEARFFVNRQFMVDDLDALRRGGRIPATVAFAGSKLDVKPLLGIDNDGKLTLTGVARGRKKGLKALVDFYQKNKREDAPDHHVIIGNADCPKDAERLTALLSKEDDSLMFLQTSIGPVIGSHVGPGMIALVFWGKDCREELSMADRIASKVRGKK